jgi:hypothetical protein
MDYNVGLFSGGITATILSVIFLIYKLKLHKRIRSNCCGRDMELGIDIDNNTPLIDKDILKA